MHNPAAFSLQEAAEKLFLDKFGRSFKGEIGRSFKGAIGRSFKGEIR